MKLDIEICLIFNVYYFKRKHAEFNSILIFTLREFGAM